MTVRGLLYRRRKGSGSFAPSSPLEGQTPLLWLRADQGVYTPGGARHFHSPDKSSLSIADNDSLSVTTSDLTISLWAYFDDLVGNGWLVSKGGAGTTGYSVLRSDASIFADIKPAAGARVIVTGGTVAANTWYHIVVTFDRDGNGVIYLNNVAGTPISIAGSAGSCDDVNPFSLGSFQAASDWVSARMSMVGVWKRMLSAAEITYLYNDVAGTGRGRVSGEFGVIGTDGAALADIAGGSLPSYWNCNENLGTDNAIDSIGTNDLSLVFAELISNGGFETAGAGGADVYASWTESITGTGTITDELVLVDAGSHATKLTAVDASNLSQISQNVMTANHRYAYSVRARHLAGGNASIYLGSGRDIDITLSTSYQTFSGTNTALGDGVFLLEAFNEAVTAYFDSVSVKAVEIPAVEGPGESTGVVDGDQITKVVSIEGNTYEFAQATASKRPLYRSSAINGKPGIDFDGIDDLLVKASAFLTGTVGTVIIVYRLDATPDTQIALSSADEASGTRYLVFRVFYTSGVPGINYEQSNNGTADALSGNSTVSANTDYAAVFASDGSTITARLNGTAQTLSVESGANNGDWWDDTTGKDNVTIGAAKISSEVNFMNGKICEVIIYPINLSAGSLAKLDSYIFGRYGLHV